MRLPGVERIRFRFAWVIGCLAAAACSPFVERESPGIFYDVQLAAPAPDTLCVEFAGEVAARTHLELRWHGPLRRPDQCAAVLNDAAAAPRREIWLTTDAVRSLLFVDLREFGGEGPTKPSRETKELGGRLAELIHEKFPAAKVTQGKRFSGALAH
jgi:hypothetical protein